MKVELLNIIIIILIIIINTDKSGVIYRWWFVVSFGWNISTTKERSMHFFHYNPQ